MGARKEVLVQLDEELLLLLDGEASRLKRSRSDLIRRAIRAWLDAVESARADAAYAEGYRRFPDDDLALTEAMARLAAESAPPYEP